jgi:hypothetical protein
MKYKTLALSLVLPFTVLAVENEEIKNKNNFTLDLANLENYKFKQIDSDVMVHQDKNKTIEIIAGKKGMNEYISILEEQLLDAKSDFEYRNLLNEIDLYTSKLNNFKQESSLVMTKKLGIGNSYCYPHLAQDYSFSPWFFSIAFTVESSYPPVFVGPLPPFQSVTIHARSQMVITQSTGVQYPYAANSYTGGNIGGGSVSATSANQGFVSHGNDTIDYTATSVMSQPNCFEFIRVQGNYE